METLVRKRLSIFAGSSHTGLTEEVAKNLGVHRGDVDIHRFANGEIYTRFMDSVRGTDAFVLQTGAEPVNEHLMELLIMLDALKRASCARVTAVIPCYPYARQDRKALAREPITSKLIADLLHRAGADRVMSVDLHSGQIQGFFDCPFDHLTAVPILTGYVQREFGSDFVAVAPDAGGVVGADRYRRRLGCDLAIVHKTRDPSQHGTSEVMGVVGDVKGRRCVLVDDMIDTAGTIVNAADALMAEGAVEVYAAATHAVLAGEAVRKLRDSPIKRVLVTDTLPIPPAKSFEKLVVLSVGEIIADAIRAVFEDESVSQIFEGDNA